MVLSPDAVVSGRYRIVRQLGHGAMGAVYEAVHLPTGRAVALKTLLPDLPNASEIAGRFRREALAANLLDHPNIIEMLDLGQEGGQLYMVMELVRGRSLRDVLDGGALGVRRSLVLARQILDGVGHAHAHGVVHRDLKPENVALVKEGEAGAEYEMVKLLDFGLVKLLDDAAVERGSEKLSRTGIVFGTPAYMAPEQALGRPVDGRTDLYAVGIMLFEMLLGRRPFVADDPMAILRLHISAPVPTLREAGAPAAWCTPPLEALVQGALRKTPAERFASAEAMRDALDAAFVSLDHLPAGT
jgi:eukaryotic-like serine/threonine-protein kinase